MWFRNARLYRITKAFDWSAEALEEALAARAFKPCGPQDSERIGWVPPLGREYPQLVFSSGKYHLVCLRREEKVLPAAVIKETVDERVEYQEEEQGRPLRRKEKNDIKDQVTQELLPKAFTRSRFIYAYVAPDESLVVVDSASSNAAEMLLSELRETLGSLPVRPPVVQQSPAFIMTQWLRGEVEPPASLQPGNECELRDDSEEGGVIRIRGLDLGGDEVRGHLDNGMSVTRLALNWEDNLEMVLDDELTIRRLKFGDGLKDRLDDEGGEDRVARFDTAFTLMTLEFARLVPALLEAFGGEDTSALVSA